MPLIVADKNIHRLEEFIPGECRLQLFDPSEGLPDLSRAEALIIRTVTSINRRTFSEIPPDLRFIGTASAGTDHIDTEWLTANGIKTANAGGCNARSVAEYVLVGLWLWTEKEGRRLSDLKVGLIGVGNAGSEVASLLEKCGIRPVRYDPPREEREKTFFSSPLDELLACDILSFHIPLTYSGKYATFHWLDEKKLENHQYDLVINAARGGVVQEKAALNAVKRGNIGRLITDVWENEPVFNDDMLHHSFLATPHIAGYSKEAKTRATAMVMKKLCDHFQRPYSGLPEIKWVKTRQYSPSEFGPNPQLREVIAKIHPVFHYQDKLKRLAGLKEAEKAERFNALRTGVAYRNEFAHIRLPESILNAWPMLACLGLRAISSDSD